MKFSNKRFLSLEKISRLLLLLLLLSIKIDNCNQTNKKTNKPRVFLFRPFLLFLLFFVVSKYNLIVLLEAGFHFSIIQTRIFMCSIHTKKSEWEDRMNEISKIIFETRKNSNFGFYSLRIFILVLYFVCSIFSFFLSFFSILFWLYPLS